jgi:FtsH-binding integral membrane protein
MKFLKALPLGIAPLVLMSYGWYLGQLHQSGYDVAGIFLFMTGLVGLVLALLFYLLTRKYSWHGKWYVNALTGLMGCGIIFALIFVYARLHG